MIWGITNNEKVVGLDDAESDGEFISETSFKRNHLQKMLAEGTLKMTVPDKPSSRNQKYYS